MNIAICDDDRKFCITLTKQLKSLETLEIRLNVDFFVSGEELLEGCTRCSYDAVFLDLYMTGITGFQTAQELTDRHVCTNIIFLTSDNAMVYDSFEYRPFYFLRKDNYIDSLAKVMEKLRSQLVDKGIFLLDNKNECEQIAVGDICYIVSDKHELVIQTTKYCYEIRRSMISVEEELKIYDFIRIHKKYLVNLKYVKKVSNIEDKVYLMNNISLDVSKRNKETVMVKFRDYQRRKNNIL